MNVKTRKTIIATVCTLAFLSIAGAAAVGCARHGHRFDDPERVKKVVAWKVDDLLDEVDADEGQRASFNAATSKIVDDGFKMKEAHKANHDEFHAELKSASPNSDKLHEMVDRRVNELQAFAHRTLDTFLAAWNELTPQQRAEIVVELEDHFSHH
ncbi:MAG: hypothetical protein GY854_26945 [Deltaproteobacteria bacterium]|nr:hypothetical protein [Deltaproteobacteria bacterium]